MSKLVLILIDFYRNFLSFDKGLLMVFAPGGACKYPVSCSEYTKIQIKQRGVLKGLSLGFKRLISCR